MTEPCDLPATEARRLIGTRRLAPSELLESCIARIEAVDHAVNAMVSRDFDRARTAAKQADAAVTRGDALGPLHGLPMGIKDLEETAGLLTTFGSPIFRDYIPTTDEGIVADSKSAGAIVATVAVLMFFEGAAQTKATPSEDPALQQVRVAAYRQNRPFGSALTRPKSRTLMAKPTYADMPGPLAMTSN